ncbi:complex III assembly factor LYRM7 [Biomphalaria glabrata]|nr:complex III assembly factor LYRM7 [Biomphalaria glabrata]
MAARSRVLESLRSVHRAKREVFEGDPYALKYVTDKIREEFRKNIHLKDPAQIEEAIIVATDSAKYLRCSVVQLRQKNNDTFELRLTKNTATQKNVPYDPTKEVPMKPRRKKCSPETEPSTT